jgi:hypothetical protein
MFFSGKAQAEPQAEIEHFVIWLSSLSKMAFVLDQAMAISDMRG